MKTEYLKYNNLMNSIITAKVKSFTQTVNPKLLAWVFDLNVVDIVKWVKKQSNGNHFSREEKFDWYVETSSPRDPLVNILSKVSIGNIFRKLA